MSGYSARVSTEVRGLLGVTGHSEESLVSILGVSQERASALWKGSESYRLTEVERVASVIHVPVLALLAPGVEVPGPVGVTNVDPDTVADIVKNDLLDPVQSVEVRILQVGGRVSLRMSVFYGRGPLRHSVDYSMPADGDAWQALRACLLSGRGVYVDEGHRLVVSPSLAGSMVCLLKVAMDDDEGGVDAWLASRLADEMEGEILN